MNNVCIAQKAWQEVFSSNAGTVYQSDEEGCLYLDFAGKIARFDFVCLARLKKIVERIDIERMLLNTSNSADIEIISMCACEHCYVLDTREIVALKELLQGTFVMFQLNNILKDRLHRLVC
ncbi:MAG: hypothetical protein V4714_07305 [Bacteroidota bacterium]